jgi:hypothetical protein
VITVDNRGLGDQEVILKSRSVNPFNGWSDWYGTDGEAVVTIQHMKYALYSQWQRDCIRFVHGEGCDHDSHAEVGDIPGYAPYIVTAVGLVIFLRAEIRDNQKISRMEKSLDR